MEHPSLGDSYPTAVIKPVEENQEPPEGWPRNPIFNAPGDVPGPPVQFGPPIESTTVKPGEGFTGIGLPENDIFYFHPDHLGSTSYITSRNGSISQHVEYIAFGEVLFEEHSSSFSSPYLFNGKELDRETNLSYYGARYLDMKSSLWLNVDPLAEKYPNISPYAYVANNPINFIDPDGRDIRHYLINHLLKKDNSGIVRYGIASLGFYNSMRDIMQTNTGRSYLSQFMKKGQMAYGYKATQNGKYSDVNLNIYQVDLKGEDSKKRGLFFMADADAQVGFEEKNGKLEINVWIGNESASDVAHEFFIHYAGVMDEIVEAFNKGGIEAAKKASKKYSEDDDHKAARDNDKKHAGMKKFMEVRKELEEKNNKYKIEFEAAHEKDQRAYKDLK